MIIDIHTYVWASLDQLGPDVAAVLRRRVAGGAEPLDASPAAHENAMRCVDGSVVMGLRADRIGARIPNELVADFVARAPGRRVGVGGIDPMADDVFDQLEQVAGLGLSGVCVSPVCQGFHPSHTIAMRVYERCDELSLPVFVTLNEPLTGQADLEFARPTGWDEVARSIPGLRIVIGELGFPHVDETLLLIGKHEHVFADISGLVSRRWQLYNALLSAASHGVMDKILFGSGFPHESPAGAIETLYTLNAFSQGTQLPSIARSSIRQIVEKDSLACLGIEAEIYPGGAEAAARAARVAPGADGGEAPERPVVDVVERSARAARTRE